MSYLAKGEIFLARLAEARREIAERNKRYESSRVLENALDKNKSNEDLGAELRAHFFSPVSKARLP